MIEVTQLYCPESGGKPGEDNTTHHLKPYAAGKSQQMVCIYCGKSEKWLREQAKIPVAISALEMLNKFEALAEHWDREYPADTGLNSDLRALIEEVRKEL